MLINLLVLIGAPAVMYVVGRMIFGQTWGTYLSHRVAVYTACVGLFLTGLLGWIT